MIRAVIFDLDGTLVQTEKLKALSYAIAVQKLLDLPEPDPRAIEAYREVVGGTREIVSQYVMEQLGLEAQLRPLVRQNRVSQPWEVLTIMRMAIYDQMVADPQVLQDNQWPHTVAFLHLVRRHGCKTGLASMSKRREALHVLRALGLERELDVVLTRDDVENPKPDPEIYLSACRLLDMSPTECLAIEDSPTGVRAALAAGIETLAVATPFTRQGLHATHLLPRRCVVEEPQMFLATVELCLQERNLGIRYSQEG
ncbi:MAG: HAD family hydrolase [Candidatus Methylomirabilales bacterium]